MRKILTKRFLTVAPAVAMTAVSMALTLAVVALWLGSVLWLPLAILVGLGLDGMWLANLAYERRLAAQGDHNDTVTRLGWGFGAVATGVLVAHGVMSTAPAAWLAVSWLPLAAKALWLVHGLWERTALTPDALEEIRGILQDSRDTSAVQRARLRAEAGVEAVRLEATTEAGARVAEVQKETAQRLATAWDGLNSATAEPGVSAVLTRVVAPEGPSSWALPMWGPVEQIPSSQPVNTPVNALENTLGTGWKPVLVKGMQDEPQEDGSEESTEGSPTKREQILSLHAEGTGQREIARQLECSPSYVNRIVNEEKTNEGA